MYRLHPQTLRLEELLRERVIGEVRQAIAEFGHRIDDPEDVRIIGSLEGGSLGDVGCYCVNALRLAFGSEPLRASAFGRFAEDGADEELAGVLEFDGGLGFVRASPPRPAGSGWRSSAQTGGSRCTLHSARTKKAGR
jgi:predicted dehydrogenase